MLRCFVFTVCVLSCCGPSSAEAAGKGGGSGKTVSVSGYTRKDGTYVAPHMRSAPGTAVREAPRIDYRTTAPASKEPRTTARLSARGDTSSTAFSTSSSQSAQSSASSATTPSNEDREQEAARLLESAKKSEAKARRVKGEGRRPESSMLFEIAKREFREIISKYSETKAALEATKLLEALKKEG